MTPRHRMLAAALLCSLYGAPARADWPQGFAHIACIPEAGALRIEHVTVSGSDFFGDALAGHRAFANRLKAWEKHGFHDERRVDQACRLADATYTISMRKSEGSERGMCGAAPAAILTFSVNGKPLLDRVTFGDDCGMAPNVRAISVYGGSRTRPIPIVTLCVGLSPDAGEGERVCKDIEGKAVLAPAPMGDSAIRDLYEAARAR